jgi:hypothetical protein
MSKTTDTVVDPGVAFEGFASFKNYDNPAEAVKAAFMKAAHGVNASQRDAVMVRVIVHVAPKAIDFESDAPLADGSCSIDGPCDSCQ